MPPLLLNALSARSRSVPRWVVVLPAALVLWTIGMASASSAALPPWPGVHASYHDSVPRVYWVQPGGWGWDAGIRPGDVVLTVDGAPVTPRALEPQALDAAQHVEVRSNVTGETLDAPGSVVAAPAALPEQVSYFAIASVFAVLGIVVYIVAAEALPATVMFVFSVGASGLLLSAVGTLRGATLLLAVTYLSLLVFTSSAVWLFLVFPTNRLRSRVGRLLAAVSVIGSLLLALGYALSVLWNPWLYEIVRPLLMIQVSVNLLVAIGAILYSLVTAFRTSHGNREERLGARRALGTVALGALAGFGPFLGLAILPTVVGARAPLSPHLAVLSVVFLPVSLAAALLSRQFLGVERLVRRGLVALVVWVLLLAPYAWSLGTLMRAGVFQTELGPTVGLTALAITVGTFPPLQRMARRWIEQRLFGDVYDFTRTVQAFGSELAQCSTVASIVDYTLSRLGKTLDLRWASIETFQPEQAYVWYAHSSVVPNAQHAELELPLVADGQTIGRLLTGTKNRDVQLSAEDDGLLVAVSPLIASALQAALLLQQLEHQVELLYERESTLVALSGRLMRVQEEERRRLALELHDDPLQRVSLLARQLADEGLLSEQAAAEDVAIALRAICYGLRPPVLDDLGLPSALDRLVSDVAARSDVQVTLSMTGIVVGDRLERDLELALYRVAQEALNNVLKHARAEHAAVMLVASKEVVELRVDDDGQGTPSDGDYRNDRSLGIVGMRERLMPWDGEVSVAARPTGGTRVIARARVHGTDRAATAGAEAQTIAA